MMESKKANGYTLASDKDKSDEYLGSPECKSQPPKGSVGSERIVDSGYAYVVLVSAFMLNMFMSAQFGTLGIWMVEYLHYFNIGKTPITWIAASQMFCGYFLGK